MSNTDWILTSIVKTFTTAYACGIYLAHSVDDNMTRRVFVCMLFLLHALYICLAYYVDKQ